MVCMYIRFFEQDHNHNDQVTFVVVASNELLQRGCIYVYFE